MAKNNIRLLNSKELEYFNHRYSFFIENEKIAVKINNYNRVTYHPLGEPFSIIAKKVRKITFCNQAIDIWYKCVSDGYNFSLIDVQQAVNKLYILMRPITVDAVKCSIKAYNE